MGSITIAEDRSGGNLSELKENEPQMNLLEENILLSWRRAGGGSGELLSGLPHLDPLESDGANCVKDRKVIKGSQCGFMPYQADSCLQWDDYLSGWEESSGCSLLWTQQGPWHRLPYHPHWQKDKIQTG